MSITFVFLALPQSDSMSSGHRLRDVEQQRPLLDRDDAEASPPVEVSRLWFIQDCCGIVCAVITWLLVFFADFVVTFVMLLPSRSFWYAVLNGVLFNSLAVLALASHLRTMLTDPVRRLCGFLRERWEEKALLSDLNVCVSSLLSSGSRSERKRHQEVHGESAAEARRGRLQVSEMLQHQTGEGSSLQVRRTPAAAGGGHTEQS